MFRGINYLMLVSFLFGDDTLNCPNTGLRGRSNRIILYAIAFSKVIWVLDCHLSALNSKVYFFFKSGMLSGCFKATASPKPEKDGKGEGGGVGGFPGKGVKSESMRCV